MAQADRFAPAIIAGKATNAVLLSSTVYPMAEGEIGWATDTDQLAMGKDAAAGGSFKFVPTEQARVALTAQVASITTTNLQTPVVDGLYRFSYYLEVTTVDATATITLTLGWTDDNGAQAQNVVNALAMTPVKNANGQLVVRGRTTGNLTYAATIAGATGSPQFALYIFLERLF